MKLITKLIFIEVITYIGDRKIPLGIYKICDTPIGIYRCNIPVCIYRCNIPVYIYR